MSVNLKSIILAAESSGRIVRKYFGKTLEVEQKTTLADYRTRADLESEKAILKVLSKNFPKFNILSEETGFINKKSEYTFIIDPLDGSNNFVLGVPAFTVSIGLISYGKILAGVIYYPILDNAYYAQKGRGAFLNGKRLYVSKVVDIEKATISYTCGYINSSKYEERLRSKLNILKVKRIIDFWSPALDYCLLASGKIEGIINNKNEIYDFTAGKIIAKEAGARITDFQGKPEESDKNDKFIASNGPVLHEKLVKIV